MIAPIKFGTDGWRAIIADDFTVENVSRVAYATALRLKKEKDQPLVIVGHDCRFGGKLFAETTARVLAAMGIKVKLSQGITSTPMVSYGIVHYKADQGVVITASHNPPEYNGYKLKGPFGGPSFPAFIAEVEALIPDTCPITPEPLSVYQAQGLVEDAPLEKLYIEHMERSFDLEAIRSSGLNFAYDAMYGAGQRVIRQLFPEATLLHCDWNPGFDGQAPEPIHKNLQEFSEVIRVSEDIASGLATDGDADRIGLYNSRGEFVDSHHIILLLIHYLYTVKGYRGEVIKSFSCCSKIDVMCAHYNIPCTTTKIGFKYICELMVNGDALVGGEESGGIAIKGHIPERDGIWMGITIWEMMAKSGKSLDQLIEEVYAITGPFAVERYDEHVPNELKARIMHAAKSGQLKRFGPYEVTLVEDLDGYKFHLSNGSWVMLRASGTEPVLRIYSQSDSSASCFQILNATKETVMAL